MEEHENKLEKAVEALKNEQVPPGPPPSLVDSTLAKLNEKAQQTDTARQMNRNLVFEGLRATKSLTKIAAAAILLIAAGYAAGRFAAPRPADMEQIRAALEPEIRKNLLNETRQYLQLGLANAYVRIQDELSQQYREDLRRAVVQTVAASNSVTNELLTELIDSFNKAQNQDRQLVAAALGQIESKRRQDRAELAGALTNLALQTEDELMRTKQDVAQYLSYTQKGFSMPDEIINSDNSNERIEQ